MVKVAHLPSDQVDEVTPIKVCVFLFVAFCFFLKQGFHRKSIFIHFSTTFPSFFVHSLTSGQCPFLLFLATINFYMSFFGPFRPKKDKKGPKEDIKGQ